MIIESVRSPMRSSPSSLPMSRTVWNCPDNGSTSLPAETDPDSYPLELLANILAGGRSSRLYRRLVDQEQAALNAEAFPELLEQTGIVGGLPVGPPSTTP